MNMIAPRESSPEKTGVGGSIPSLATNPKFQSFTELFVTSPIVLPDWKHSLATGRSGSTGSEGECAATSPGISSEEVGGRLESFLGRALIFAGDQKARFVLFVGVGVPGETPSIFVSEVANPAEMQGGISKPLDPLVTRLARRRSTSARHVGFAVHVDVA